MALTTNPVNGDYSKYLFETIKAHEAVRTRVYYDTKGIPTIGVGYALVVFDTGKKEWVVRPDISDHLREIGVLGQEETFGQKFANDDVLLNKIVDSLNKGDVAGAKNLIDWNGKFEIESVFSELDLSICEQRAEILFHHVAPEYEERVFASLRSSLKQCYNDDVVPVMEQELRAVLAGTEELATLTSLTYNGVFANCPKLQAAVIMGDRAEAWYQIAYDTNGGAENLAARRYGEANAFRPHTAEEWEQFNQLCVDRQTEIAAYHATHGKPADEYIVNWSFPLDDHQDLAFIHSHNEAGNIVPLWTDAKTSESTWTMLQSVNPQGATVVAMADGSIHTITRQGVLVTDADGHSVFHYKGSNGKWQDVEVNDDGTLNEQSHYIVKKGDSLGAIAKAIGVSQQELQELNGITNPNQLKIGQKLLLPAGTPFESEAQGYLDGLRAATQWAVDSARLLAADEASPQYLAAMERIPAHALPQMPNVPMDDALPDPGDVVDGEIPIAGPAPIPEPITIDPPPNAYVPSGPPLSLGQIGGINLDIDFKSLVPNWNLPSPAFNLNGLGGLGLNGAGLNLGTLALPPAFQNLIEAAPQLQNQYESLQAALDAGDWGQAAGLAQAFINNASQALTGENAVNLSPDTLNLLNDATRFSQALDRGDLVGMLTTGGKLVNAFGIEGVEVDLGNSANLQGLGALASLYTALQNGDSAAIFKYGLETLNYFDALGEGGSTWAGMSNLQGNVGAMTSLTGLLNALDSGDSAAALSSGLQLAQQVSTMAGNTALANTLGQAVPWGGLADILRADYETAWLDGGAGNYQNGFLKAPNGDALAIDHDQLWSLAA